MLPHPGAGTLLSVIVSRLICHPLKSARGIELSETQIGPDGLIGDRRWALEIDEAVVGAKQVPELATWWVRPNRQTDSIEVDEGTGWVDAQQAAAAIGGRIVAASTGHRMTAAVHLVTAGAAQAPDAPSGCDPNPRANIVLDGAAGAERGWLGRRLSIGSAVLEVTTLPKHCLGVYADVITAGRVSIGDQVYLA